MCAAVPCGVSEHEAAPEASVVPVHVSLPRTNVTVLPAIGVFSTGSVSVAVGKVRSSCHVPLAGLASGLPARSQARISRVSLPAAGVGAGVCGAAAGREGPPARARPAPAVPP